MITSRDISLCTIYRNEEGLLPSFLEHHRRLFGELILVDTGSDDRSGEIVASAGLERHRFDWTGDFSQARNHSLALARLPYICVLDVDEILLARDLEKAVELLQDGTLGGLSLCQINLGFFTSDGDWKSTQSLPEPFRSMTEKYTVSRLIRIFRNDPRVRFTGAIHEVVGHSLHAAGYNSKITDIPVYHLGWVDSARSPEEQAKKDRRNREIIREAYARDPSVENGYYLLTVTDAAAERLRIAYELIRRHPDVLDFRIVLATSAAETGQWSRALDYTRRGLLRFPESETLKVLEIRALNHCAEPALALERCEALGENASRREEVRIERLKALIITGRTGEAQSELNKLRDNLSQETLTAIGRLMALAKP